MCVIVHQPENTVLGKDRAARLWKRNSDGGGFAYITPANKVRSRRFMEFDSFWNSYSTLRERNPNTDFLVHMRIATHGVVSLDNVHPFQVDRHTVMAHNGVLYPMTKRMNKKEDPRSDTKYFVDEVLPELPEDWLDNPILIEMVEDWIGKGNKLMFLTTNPILRKNVYILNRTQGSVVDEMWFSNTSGVYEFVPRPRQKEATKRQYGFSSSYPVPGYTPGHSSYCLCGSCAAERARLQQIPEGTTIYANDSDLRRVVVDGKYVPMSDEEYANYLELKYGLEEATNENKEVENPVVSSDHEMDADIEAEIIEAEEGYDDLELKRAELGLVKPIFYDPIDHFWSCLGCDEWVSKAGDCACWYKLCLDCEAFAGDCTCNKGWSYNLIDASDAAPDLVATANQKGWLAMSCP